MTLRYPEYLCLVDNTQPFLKKFTLLKAIKDTGKRSNVPQKKIAVSYMRKLYSARAVPLSSTIRVLHTLYEV
jgi:hypothetical protein